MAAVVPAILLAANVVTQQLKPALADLRIVDLRGDDAMYLGLVAERPLDRGDVARAVPRARRRPAAAPARGARSAPGYAIAVGYSLVVLGFHLPSDVLGGFLVAATFTLLGAAALAAPRRAGRARRADAGGGRPPRGPVRARARAARAVGCGRRGVALAVVAPDDDARRRSSTRSRCSRRSGSPRSASR